MTNDQVDALLRRLDVGATPDAAFVEPSLAVLSERARAARRVDASWRGRLGRTLVPRVPAMPATSGSRPVAVLGLLLLLLLALALTLVVVGTLNHSTPIANGPLIVSVQGALESVDPVTGAARPILPATEGATGASRSPDGRTVTYWTETRRSVAPLRDRGGRTWPS